MFHEIAREVSKLNYELMRRHGGDRKYQPSIKIYMTFETYNALMNEIPKGFSQNYEMVESCTINGFPFFVIGHGEGHPPWLVVDTAPASKESNDE